MMTPEQVQSFFTRSDGAYLFARWGRPVSPVIFGVEDATLSVLKGAVEAVCLMAGHHMAETDPELGVNMMMFFCRDWDELAGVPDLDRLVPDLGPLLGRLKGADANQYRNFRFDGAGAIKACFIFIRMDAAMQALPAETIALGQAVQSIVLWSDTAFTGSSPLAVLEGGETVLRPEIGALVRAGYATAMPVATDDPGHALRLFARMGAAQ